MVIVAFTLELYGVKYKVSELGAYFECEGVKCSYFNFTCRVTMETFVVQRSRSMVCTTLENTLDQ